MMPLPVANRHQGKIRVLILTDEMEVGGTQRQIVHIARGLDRALFDPTVVFFCNRSYLTDELQQAGISVVEIRKDRRLDLHFVRELIKFIDDGRFDVMHCFAFSGELWGAIARRFVAPSRRPVLITSVRGKYEWYGRLQWWIKRWTASQSACVIANSHSGRDHTAARLGLRRQTIDVVYNGVDEPPLAVITRPPPSGEIIMAVFVGRLVEVKNIPVLLRAMRSLRVKGAPVRLRIVGDGPLRQKYADLIADYGLENAVELLGERSDVAMQIALSDFMVLPSYHEGLSNVILEAMMVGRPVIASNVGGNAELVEHMQTGLLFENDNDTELADAMLALIMNPEMRAAFGAQGRRQATDRFAITAMVNSMQEFYSNNAAAHHAQGTRSLG